jgi:formylglycine-generating enzyme required for sulfatase activity/tRNA A-37 threonylcarbamoyl transferase component Bud32
MGIPAELAQALAEVSSRYSLPDELVSDVRQALGKSGVLPLLTATTITGDSADPPRREPARGAVGMLDSVRYIDRGPLGEGGSSVVRRVFDTELGRNVAAKLLRPEFVAASRHVHRFVEEARVTAQLDHPGIVPVYELSRLPTGQQYYVMREVKGETLAAAIEAVHRASAGGSWSATSEGWTLHGLLDALRRVCETVAFSHSRGVVHRDLKPSNIMLGKFGEVYTLDFGVAKLVGGPELADEAIQTGRIDRATRAGGIVGTPPYMAPEQALGQAEAVGPWSDVYALGAILYEILCGKQPFADVANSREVLQRLREGTTLPSAAEIAARVPGSPPIPPALQEICLRAMDREPARRFPSASDLSGALASWLQGTRDRERALRMVVAADGLLREVAGLRASAAEARAEAAGVLGQLPPFAPAAVKEGGWGREDEAKAMEAEAARKEVRYVQELQAALTHSPDLPEVHARLADHYLARHQDAERRRSWSEAGLVEVSLRAHEHGRHASYLRGIGRLSVVTDPADATVTLFRYVTKGRRLVEELVGELGTAPIRELELPMGSYLLLISHPTCGEVRYPVYIERAGHWDGMGPDGTVVPISLPSAGALGSDEAYVPAGWFIAGGDPEALNGLPQQRIWVDGFVMKRFPTTNAQYLAFLNDLVAKGREADALRWAPRERGGAPGEEGALICGRDGRGLFTLAATAAGVPLPPDVPVCMIDWASAAAYAAWYAEREGRSWRLAGELEREKAARGVDARGFPWGDFLDPTWCLMRLSHSDMGKAFMAPVDSYPIDCSPYGLRGLAGNARDWCFDAYQPMGPRIVSSRPVLSNGEDVQGPGAGGAHRVYRGGTWREGERSCRAAFRDAPPAYFRDWDISFRIVRPW